MVTNPHRKPIWGHVIRVRRLESKDAIASFINERFKVKPSTFTTLMSRGFSRHHEPELERLCTEAGNTYDPDVWLSEEAKKEPDRTHDDIQWASRPLVTSEQFYDELEQIYRSATDYQCLRVGGVFSSGRTRFVYDDDDLALPPNPESSVRIAYLRVFWKRVSEGLLTGESVHLVRNLERLVELWATVEYTKLHPKGNANRVYLVPVAQDEYKKPYPAMGVRIVNHDRCLFSVPAENNGKSAYSSWIRSYQLSSFAREAINRAKTQALDLTGMPTIRLLATIEDAFTKIKSGSSDTITNYGRLETFDDLAEVKRRMLEWARDDLWLPVIA